MRLWIERIMPGGQVARPLLQRHQLRLRVRCELLGHARMLRKLRRGPRLSAEGVPRLRGHMRPPRNLHGTLRGLSGGWWTRSWNGLFRRPVWPGPLLPQFVSLVPATVPHSWCQFSGSSLRYVRAAVTAEPGCLLLHAVVLVRTGTVHVFPPEWRGHRHGRRCALPESAGPQDAPVSPWSMCQPGPAQREFRVASTRMGGVHGLFCTTDTECFVH